MLLLFFSLGVSAVEDLNTHLLNVQYVFNTIRGLGLRPPLTPGPLCLGPVGPCSSPSLVTWCVPIPYDKVRVAGPAG